MPGIAADRGCIAYPWKPAVSRGPWIDRRLTLVASLTVRDPLGSIGGVGDPTEFAAVRMAFGHAGVGGRRV